MARRSDGLTRREFIQRSGAYSAAVVSLLSGCPSGSDEDDPGDTPYCDDTCQFSGDTECDDGGQGSQYSVCNYGTDCSDCGVRYGPAGYSNQYSNGYSNYSNSYYSNTYSNYSNYYANTYSNYSNYYSNYSNYYSNYYNYSDYVYYYNYFVNSF